MTSVTARGAEQLSEAERVARLADRRTREIEKQIAEMEEGLHSLPEAEWQPSTHDLGFHSIPAPSPDVAQWVQIDLGAPYALDGVALVGARNLAHSEAPESYAFPRAFRVEVGGDPEMVHATVLANFPQIANPNEFPVFIEGRGVSARYVRLTVPRLPSVDGQWYFALGELMVLSGNRNLAATLPPKAVTSSGAVEAVGVWNDAYLIDGISVLGAPIGGKNSPTRGWRTQSARADHPIMLQLDLGSPMPVDEVRLAPAQLPGLLEISAYGFPRQIEVFLGEDEQSLQKPSARKVIPKERMASPANNLVTVAAEEKMARLVEIRLYPPRLTTDPRQAGEPVPCALSEVQVYSGGKNVARGLPVTISESESGDGWSPAALTDGFNSTHQLVEWTDWLRGLSQRGVKLGQIAALREERAARLRREGELVERGFLGVLVAIAVGASLWIHTTQRRRQREIAALRDRIAGDLHDEIGSNLGGIAILSRVAADTPGWPESARHEFAGIHAIARQTHETMRDLVWLLESDRDGGATLNERCEAAARALLAGKEWKVQFTGQPLPERLPLNFRRHVFFAFKEALHNAARHSQARRVCVVAYCAAREFVLSVVDDGLGFDGAKAPAGSGLASLRHRA